MLLGLHTYSLNLHGIGQAWDADFKLPWPRQLSTFQLFDKILDFGLDGVHLDDGVLENLEFSFLKEIGAAAKGKNLYLEYNFSLDLGGMGIGIQHDLEEAIAISHALGSDIVKMSMDLVRPKPVAASRFHPEIKKQLSKVAEILKSSASSARDAGVRIAVENHCDVFSEELLFLLDEVNSPQVGACIDTVNAFHVTEDPMTAIRNLAPRAFTNHFRDDRIDFKRDGFRLTVTPVGEGDMDMVGAYEIIKTKSSMNRINIETDINIPLDDMETAMAMEVDAIKRSAKFCREVLGIKRNLD
jgi:3-oxoisoapionate decarboxylase